MKEPNMGGPMGGSQFAVSETKAETAVLVGLITKEQDEAKTKEYLDELEFLAETAGVVVVKRFTQRVGGPSSITYTGKGKLEEIRRFIQQEEENDREVGMAIFDDELSAKQLRNIEHSLCAHKLPTQKLKWNWRNIDTCCPACNVCGPTWNAKAVEAEVEAEKEAWDFVDLVRLSSRWTAASS